MTSGEVSVFKLPAFRVGDLAEAMVERYAPALGHDPDEVRIERVGARPAERVHEKLVSANESTYARDLGDMFAILPQRSTPPGASGYSTRRRSWR